MSPGDIQWADVIFVMEKKHRDRLVKAFPRLMDGRTVHVLEIPDAYRFMDPELVEILEAVVGACLGLQRV